MRIQRGGCGVHAAIPWTHSYVVGSQKRFCARGERPLPRDNAPGSGHLTQVSEAFHVKPYASQSRSLVNSDGSRRIV